MPEPLSLKFQASLVCMQTLLLENPVADDDNNIPSSSAGTENRQYLTSMIETGCFTVVSKEILDRIVKSCPDKLTNKLLYVLSPPYIQGLCLNSCSNVTIMGLVETLEKCSHLHHVDLTDCSQVIHPVVVSFLEAASIPLTTVILEENANVTDEVVHELVRGLPCLKVLNISSCKNISNKVFLVDELQQRTREVTPFRLEDDEYKYNQACVDISGCRQLVTEAVIHLASLCGPKLTHVNISCTSVDCIGLLYLAGYSVPAILDILLVDDALKSDEGLKTKFQTFRELREMYIEMYCQGVVRDITTKNVKQQTESSKVVDESKDSERKTAGKRDTTEVLVETDIKLEMTGSESFGKEDYLDPAEIVEGVGELSVREGYSNRENQWGDVAAERRSDESRLSRKMVYFRNGEIVSVHCSEHGEDCESDVEIDENGEVINVPSRGKLGIEKYDGARKDKDIKKPTALSNEKLNFDYATQLYVPKILSLNIRTINFVSRRPYLGQLCLKKFFEANRGLKKLAVKWKDFTQDFTKKVAHNLTDLIEVELEECTLLQTEGVEALGRYCRQLQSLNIRGVVFISDRALIPYLSNENLVHLQLAESNITDVTLFNLAKHLSGSLTSLDLSFCEEVTEKGINAICSSCSRLKKLWLYKLPVSNFTMRLLSETVDDLLEVSVGSADMNNDDTMADEGILTMANFFTNLRVIDISWNLVLTDLSLSAVMMNCCHLEEGNFKGLKQISIQPFLPIIAAETEQKRKEDCAILDGDLPLRSTVYAPSLRVLDLDYCDFVDDMLLQRIINVCRGTLKATDYYGQNLVPE